MTYSYAVTTATAGQTNIAVPFPYLLSVHVKLRINDQILDPTGYSFSSPGVMTLGTPALGGEEFRVYRETPAAQPAVTFTTGVFNHLLLNKANLQLLYVVQEAYDTAIDAQAISDQTLEYLNETIDVYTNATVLFAQMTELYGDFDALQASSMSDLNDLYDDMTAAGNAALAAIASARSGATSAIATQLATATTLYNNCVALVASIGASIHSATSKATPVDADEMGFWDSVANAFKKLSFANLKTWITSFFVPKTGNSTITGDISLNGDIDLVGLLKQNSINIKAVRKVSMIADPTLYSTTSVADVITAGIAYNAVSPTSSLLVIVVAQCETDRAGVAGNHGMQTNLRRYTGSSYVSTNANQAEMLFIGGVAGNNLIRDSMTLVTVLSNAEKRSDRPSPGAWSPAVYFASFYAGCTAKVQRHQYILVEFEP